jgi:hypothetical protein
MSRSSLLLYFGGVLMVLLTLSTTLVLVARAKKWQPKPIKPTWAVLAICGAVLLAGSVCSIAAQDIHILYWWLLGLPIAAILFPLTFLAANLFGRLFIASLLYVLQKGTKKR